ncbi:MAG: hypothetical protein ACYC0Y_28700, partial [Pirellulales bacterium]
PAGSQTSSDHWQTRAFDQAVDFDPQDVAFDQAVDFDPQDVAFDQAVDFDPQDVAFDQAVDFDPQDVAFDQAVDEIDENVTRNSLSALEEARALKRRKEIYEALHPETKQGHGPGRGHTEKKRQGAVSFTEDTATKTGRSKRTVERQVSIANSLPENVQEAVLGLPIADNKSELKALAKLPADQQQEARALTASTKPEPGERVLSGLPFRAGARTSRAARQSWLLARRRHPGPQEGQENPPPASDRTAELKNTPG